MRNWYYHRPVKEPFEYILSSPKWAECLTCADLEGFVRGGSNSKTVFLLVDEGIEDPISLQMGHHRPAIETPFKWRFAGMPIMAKK